MKKDLCCSENSNCCSPRPKPKATAKEKNNTLVIDFLYLDLNTCERCMGTQNNLDDAIKEVSSVLKSAGFKTELNKIHVNSKELAIKYEFLSSPTIRINGQDIALEVKESCCQDCGDICGDNVDCRVWEYNGKEYNEPPKEMIVNALLKSVYSPNNSANTKKEAYFLPKNLELFFEGLKNQK